MFSSGLATGETWIPIIPDIPAFGRRQAGGKGADQQ
jgi:hypothetical protein